MIRSEVLKYTRKDALVSSILHLNEAISAKGNNIRYDVN